MGSAHRRQRRWRERSRSNPLAGAPALVGTLLQVVLLAAGYVVLGKLGLAMVTVGKFAAFVWPPAGISLAALLLMGLRLWPGVALGAFVVNVWIGAAPLHALAIALGNTLEAVLAAYALKRFAGFRSSLDRLRDVLALVLVGATLSTAVSATIGVATTWNAGVIATSHFAPTWLAWYVGDALGILVFGSLLLAWGTARPTTERGQPKALRLCEVGVLGSALAVVSWLIFFEGFGPPYALFPLLIWAAVRFEARGATAATFLVSAIAIWGTSLHRGPFATHSLEQSLLDLQIFMAVAAITALILAAVIGERWRTEVLRRREELLMMMSHDLRNPLTAIEVASGALEKQFSSDQRDGRAGKQVSTIRHAARRMSALIHDLLELAAAEAGRLAIHREPHDAGAILTDAIEMMQPLAAQKSLTLSRECPNEPLRVLCDRERILEVLSNLIGNAIKFGPESGTVSVTARASGGDAWFSVTDTGPGIPPEQLSCIFDRFWQGKQAPWGGIGLGLAITKKLVEAHGRKISVESRTGRGSTFSFSLPRC
jgi:signal transduction histidine kinase